MSGKVSQSFRKQADAAEQSLSRQALAAQKAGISVGQYKAAMRTLPAQFTDIVTQLAGGQNPFLIMLQQGADQRFIRWTAQPAYPAEGGTSRDQGCL